MRKRTKVVLCVLAVVLLLLYGLYVATRFTPVTRYHLFSNRIFSLNAEEIQSVGVRSRKEAQWRPVKMTEREDVERCVALLNDIRYRAWVPSISESPDLWVYRLIIETTDGETFVFMMHKDSLVVNGIGYILASDYFAELCAIGDRGPVEP